MKTKNPNQTQLKFNEPKSISINDSSKKEAKQIHLDPRREIYTRILNRKME